MMTLVMVELRRWAAMRAWASGESWAWRLIGVSCFGSPAGTGLSLIKLEYSFSNFLAGFRVAKSRFARNLGA
jgi:hypothetical protein